MAEWNVYLKPAELNGQVIWTAMADRDGRAMYDGMGKTIELALVDLAEALCQALEDYEEEDR